MEIQYKETVGPSENTVSSLKKYFIQLGQIQSKVKKKKKYPLTRNAIYSFYECIISLKLKQYTVTTNPKSC